jgi:hypothetical protein
MAGFAPPRSAALTSVMVHSDSCPTRCSAVTGLAVQRCTIQQLSFGNMVGRLGQSAGDTLRQEITVVARLAGRRGHHRVIHGYCGCKTSLRPMAGITSCGTRRNGNMSRRLAFCRSPVMAGVTSAGSYCICGRVREHYRQPTRSGLMAALTARQHRVVRSVVWSALPR